MPALILVAYSSLLMLGLLDNIRGPLFPDLVHDLALGGTGGSAFYAVASLLAVAGSWSASALIRGRDPMRVLAFASVVFGLGVLIIARAEPYYVLMLGAAVFGWGYGSLNVLQNVIVSEASPPEKRRRYLNGLQSMYGISAWLAPVTATFLRGAGLQWREILLLLAFLPLLAAIPAWRANSRIPAAAQAAIEGPWSRREWWACVGFAALLAVYLWGELAVSTRMVLWLRDVNGFTPASADAQLALFFMLLLAARLILAFVALPKVSNWTILTVCVFSSAGFFLAGLRYSPYFMALCGFTMAPFYPVIMDQAAKTFGAKAPRAIGAVIGTGNLSIVAMHLTIGYLSDLSDLTTALYVGPAALLIVGVALLTLRRGVSIMGVHVSPIR